MSEIKTEMREWTSSPAKAKPTCIYKSQNVQTAGARSIQPNLHTRNPLVKQAAH